MHTCVCLGGVYLSIHLTVYLSINIRDQDDCLKSPQISGDMLWGYTWPRTWGSEPSQAIDMKGIYHSRAVLLTQETVPCRNTCQWAAVLPSGFRDLGSFGHVDLQSFWGFLHLASVKEEREKSLSFILKITTQGRPHIISVDTQRTGTHPWLGSCLLGTFWKRRCTATNLCYITLWLICLLGSLFSTNIASYSLLMQTHNLGSAWLVTFLTPFWYLSTFL